YSKFLYLRVLMELNPFFYILVIPEKMLLDCTHKQKSPAEPAFPEFFIGLRAAFYECTCSEFTGFHCIVYPLIDDRHYHARRISGKEDIASVEQCAGPFRHFKRAGPADKLMSV